MVIGSWGSLVYRVKNKEQRTKIFVGEEKFILVANSYFSALWESLLLVLCSLI